MRVHVADHQLISHKLTFLRDNDCDQMQGWYFSPALSQKSLEEMVCSDTRLPG